MKTITAVIEIASDGTYSVYCANEMFSGMGSTADAAKSDMIEAIVDYREYCQKEGRKYPAWLDDDYQFEYKFDAQSFLKYYDGVITPTALARLSGINPKQMWSYAHGKTKPRRPQVEKIQNGLHKLAAELSAVTLL